MTKPYAIQYQHNGKTRLMRLHADSFEDAKRQLSSAYYNGEAQEVVAEVKAPRWLSKLIGI